MGQKLSCGRSCIHGLPSTHNWLAWPQIAFLSSTFLWASYVGTILQVWSDGLLLWLHTPRGPHPCTRGSDLWPCTQTPPFIQFAQKGCQSTGLEQRIPLIYLKFRKSGPKYFREPPQKTINPPRPPPLSDPLRLDPYIYQSKALDVRIPNI